MIIAVCYFMSFSVMADSLIDQTLDNFHQAAAKADTKAYFDLLTEDAVFLGTDATERWSKAEFKVFVAPYFSKGKGWLYVPVERSITINNAGDVAFFDELLKNENYGLCRGSGVLWKTPLGWKIAQYNLSIPLPNDLASDVVKIIKSFESTYNK